MWRQHPTHSGGFKVHDRDPDLEQQASLLEIDDSPETLPIRNAEPAHCSTSREPGCHHDRSRYFAAAPHSEARFRGAEGSSPGRAGCGAAESRPSRVNRRAMGYLLREAEPRLFEGTLSHGDGSSSEVPFLAQA